MSISEVSNLFLALVFITIVGTKQKPDFLNVVEKKAIRIFINLFSVGLIPMQRRNIER
jgi:hypothetical protein